MWTELILNYMQYTTLLLVYYDPISVNQYVNIIAFV